MDILPPAGEPWSRRLVELSEAEREGRYAPEFDDAPKRPRMPCEAVGVSD
jgi:hypothetical protein